MSVVISLCDLTGNMAAPWVEAGYRALLVDPQHQSTSTEAGVTRFAGTVEDAMPMIAELIRRGEVAMVFGFPPCTDLATSGAGWFKAKYAADPLFQARAVSVAEQCRTIGRASSAPWMVENPVSVLSSIFGRAQHTFHPLDFAALEPGDNYRKRTCLWTGGGFVMPAKQPDPELGPPDQRILLAPDSLGRQRLRSATPKGFARAVFLANTESVPAVLEGAAA